MAYGDNLLSSGATRTYVAQFIVGGSAFQTLLVDGWFRLILKRSPTMSEGSEGAALLRNGATDETLESKLFGSSGFFHKRANSSSATFVDRLYQILLHKLPDKSSSNLFLRELKKGTKRSQVAHTVLVSVSSQTRLVTGLYESYLKRPPAKSELDAALNELKSGITDEALRASLVGSDEFEAGIMAGFVGRAYQDLLSRKPGTQVIRVCQRPDERADAGERRDCHRRQRGVSG